MVRRTSCLLLVVILVLASAFAQDAKSQTLSVLGVKFTFSDTLTWKTNDMGNTGFMTPDKGTATVVFMESKNKQCAEAITTIGNPIVSPFSEGWFKIAADTPDKSIETCIESPKGTYLAKIMGIDAKDPGFQNLIPPMNALGKALASAVTSAPAAPAGPTLQTLQVFGIQFQVTDSVLWEAGTYGGQQYVMDNEKTLALILSPSPIKSCGKVMDRLGGKVSNTYAEGWYKTLAERSGSLNFCIEGRRDTYIGTITSDVLNKPKSKNLAVVMAALGKSLKN